MSLSLVSGYGSDSDSDEPVGLARQPSIRGNGEESGAGTSAATPDGPSTSSSSLSASFPAPKKTGIGISLPAPKARAKRRDGPVKIAIEKPEDMPDDGADLSSSAPATKKPRLSPSGPDEDGHKPKPSSALFSMLPAPKKIVQSVVKPKTSSQPPPASLGVTTFGSDGEGGRIGGEGTGKLEAEPVEPAKATSLVPSSVRKGRTSAARAGKEATTGGSEPAKPKAAANVDFFSLGTTISSPSTTPPASSSVPPSRSLKISAAPVLEEKPSHSVTPSDSDPYPGFYQLPDGTWQAKDEETYRRWMEVYQSQSEGAGGTGTYGVGSKRMRTGGAGSFDAGELEGVDLVEVNAAQGERLENVAWPPVAAGAATGGARGAALVGEDQKPQFKAPGKSGNRARQRGQLSSLLTQAFENRAELEEKYAQGRNNKREAGRKYGF